MPDESTGRHRRKDGPDDELADVQDAELVPSAPIAAAEPAWPALDSGYTAGGVPTFDAVREKIENRYATSLGAAELDAETPEGRSIAEQYEARHKAGAERLEQIRASMHPDQKSTGNH
jgi:phage shock protein A